MMVSGTNNVRPQQNALRSVFIGFALILLFPPIPLGLRTPELSILGLAALFILFVCGAFRFKLTRIKFTLLLFFITITATVVCVNRGDHFVLFQFFRGAIFTILLMGLLQVDIRAEIFERFERILPYLTASCALSAFLYFVFGSELYNSTMSIPYEEATYKRFFVYPTYFFLLLLFYAVYTGKSTQYVYVLLLAVSGSKAIYMSIFLIYASIFFRRISLKSIMTIFFGLTLIVATFYYGGAFERTKNFEDPWRYYEPRAALARLTDPIRFLIGNGAGIPYWRERYANISPEDSGDDVNRAALNSLYDVHNGPMTLALRFGIPLAICYLIAIFKALPRIKKRWVLALSLFINILFSHGPVQTTEALGLALGIRYLVYKFQRTGESSPFLNPRTVSHAQKIR